jgi:hypothetical protein
VCVGKERAAKVQCKGAMPVASGSDAREFMAWPFESISSRIKAKIRMVCAGLEAYIYSRPGANLFLQSRQRS